MRSNFVIVLSVLSIVFLSHCTFNSSEKKTSTASDTVYLNHHDSAKYVGISTCRQCHSGIYDSFIKTGMGQSFDVASKQKSAAQFKGKIIYDKYADLNYLPFWSGDTMKIMEFRLKGKDTIHKRLQSVNYIVGSGQHTNSHIYSSNGYYYQMPLTFYTQKGDWDMPPGFESGANSRFSRKIGVECMSCHNAVSDFVQGSENKYLNVAQGIDCERCHGPGSIHVALKSTGNIVDTSKYIDYSIVNPGKLSPELQFDLCQRCHLQGNAVLKGDNSFYDFKPGMKLSDVMTLFLPKYENGEKDFIMASHADRLKMSKCFMNTSSANTKDELRPYKNALTCVTCHNPHVSVKETGKEVFNNACKNCHATGKQKACTEAIALRKKKEDNCFACHMPRSGSIDIPHVSITDHYIRKPVSEQEVQKVKKFLGLYAINEKNVSATTKARAYINQFEKFNGASYMLDSAMNLLPHNSKENIDKNLEEIIHIVYLKNDLKALLNYVEQFDMKELMNKKLNIQSGDNKSAWTCYRIGEAYMQNENIEKAGLFFNKAVVLAPFNLEFKNKQAIVLMSLGAVQKAKNVFESILKEDPLFVSAMVNLAYVYLLEEDVVAANKYLDKAIQLNPDDEQALLNKAQAHIMKQEYKKAIELVKRVLKKDPNNKKAKEALVALKKTA